MISYILDIECINVISLQMLNLLKILNFTTHNVKVSSNGKVISSLSEMSEGEMSTE